MLSVQAPSALSLPRIIVPLMKLDPPWKLLLAVMVTWALFTFRSAPYPVSCAVIRETELEPEMVMA